MKAYNRQRMNPDSAAVERAFDDFLESRGLQLQALTLGSAFKVMLEFQRDVAFEWVDPEWDALSLEWDELRDADSSSAGFLGMFKTVTPGDLTGYRVLVSRTLEPLDEDSTVFVILNVALEYAVTNPEIAEFTANDQMIDRHDFESLEEFVKSAFELSVFRALAVETPRSVAVTLEAA